MLSCGGEVVDGLGEGGVGGHVHFLELAVGDAVGDHGDRLRLEHGPGSTGDGAAAGERFSVGNPVDDLVGFGLLLQGLVEAVAGAVVAGGDEEDGAPRLGGQVRGEHGFGGLDQVGLEGIAAGDGDIGLA